MSASRPIWIWKETYEHTNIKTTADDMNQKKTSNLYIKTKRVSEGVRNRTTKTYYKLNHHRCITDSVFFSNTLLVKWWNIFWKTTTLTVTSLENTLFYVLFSCRHSQTIFSLEWWRAFRSIYTTNKLLAFHISVQWTNIDWWNELFVYDTTLHTNIWFNQYSI